MNKKSMILFLAVFSFLLIFTANIYAAPPQTNIQVSTADKKIQIDYPKSGIQEQNKPFTTQFRTFNVSSGKFLDNNTCDCNVTLIDNKGNIIYQKSSEYNSTSRFWYNKINSSYFDETGRYRLDILCIDGEIDGFVSGQYDVTPSGKSGENNIAYVILILAISYITGFVGFFNKNMPISAIGGLIMMPLGIYMITQGIVIYQDWFTNALAYLTIGLGAIFSLTALVEYVEDSF